MRGRVRTLVLLSSTVIAACGGTGTVSNGTGGSGSDTGFVVTGNPEAPAGATWSYKGTVEGVSYDLTGVLYQPPGAGPFPAVLLSHGADGSAAFFSGLVAPTMVSGGSFASARTTRIRAAYRSDRPAPRPT